MSEKTVAPGLQEHSGDSALDKDNIGGAAARRLARLEETLRQERETFNQRKKQNQNWFRLKVAMGLMALVMLPVVILICGYVLVHPEQYTPVTLGVVASTLLADLCGIIATVWRAVLSSGGSPELAPVTTVLPDSETAATDNTT
jgi:hypothetical protein